MVLVRLFCVLEHEIMGYRTGSREKQEITGEIIHVRNDVA